MIIKELYKYSKNNSVIFSLKKPEVSFEQMYRLIADEGQLLTFDGESTFSAIDVESTEGWYEVPAPQDEQENLSPQGELYREFLESKGIPTA